MPTAPTRFALIALVAFALLAVVISLVNLRRAASTPIVIHSPGGTANAAALVPAALSPQRLPPAAVPAGVPVSSAAAVPKPAPSASALIYVHVAGAVKHPSLYQLASGSRVWHAIKAAGGPSANADENAVNLAAKIHDGEKIFVPTKAAVVQAAAAPKEATEAVSPPSAPIANRAAHAPASAKRGIGTQDRRAGKPAKLVSASQGQVNINTAGTEQLQELPGIGPAMAGRIVGYREQAGQFQKAEDLMNVGGIGPKKFERIAPLIKLH